MTVFLLKRRISVNIIPSPLSCECKEGALCVEKFTLSQDDYVNDLQRLNAKIELSPEFFVGSDSTDPKQNEAYALEINKDGIFIKARSQAGVFYAYTTLSQLIANYSCDIPYCSIEDKPRFEYRGFMLDVGRYFMPVDNIKNLIRLCAMHKINKFRLHITEDQGWRMEIKKYPLLTLKGSIRKGTNFSHKQHSGFYTQAQIRQLVEYCRNFNIELIPEIDMPGHSRAAIACYPYLGCFDRDLPVATHWGVKHDILCAGKESTYEFVKNVLDEVCEVFDSRYVHIGGDEAPKLRWEICPHCQKKMAEEGLQNEEQLQSYFVNRLAEYLHSKGKEVMMWNEFSPTFMTDKSIVRQFWSNPSKDQTAIQDELRQGLKYVNSDANCCYLDLPEKTVTLKKGYFFNPVVEGAENGILGIEACLWSEYVPDYKKAVRLTLPRLCALGENMWTDIPSDKKNYDDFLQRLDVHSAYLKNNGYKVSDYSESPTHKIKKFFEWIWFNRRPLHWEGLHNAVDNAHVKRTYGKKYKKIIADIKADVDKNTADKSDGQ